MSSIPPFFVLSRQETMYRTGLKGSSM
jgi:hypothetical protein